MQGNMHLCDNGPSAALSLLTRVDQRRTAKLCIGRAPARCHRRPGAVQALTQQFATHLRPGGHIVLRGPRDSGKTTLPKAVSIPIARSPLEISQVTYRLPAPMPALRAQTRAVANCAARSCMRRYWSCKPSSRALSLDGRCDFSHRSTSARFASATDCSRSAVQVATALLKLS